jgi:hypothetical protein
MIFPWISRSSHAVIVGILTTQVEELKQERKLLLDRLATLGLGGPIFSIPEQVVVQEEEESEIEADEIQELMSMKHRPTKLSDALTRKAYRDYTRLKTGPSVKWIPDRTAAIKSALDEAEKLGKEQAS